MRQKMLLATMAALSLWVSVGAAQEMTENPLNKTNNCVIVYLKIDNSQPNLTIACDGERVLSHTVRTEDQLEDASQFKADLFAAFQAMVNSDQKKKCNQYDLKGFWWASCLR